MKFIKKINNNVAFAQDDAGVDYIVLGKGIGFTSSPGTILSDEDIDRSFKAESELHDQGSLDILKSMAPEIIEITTKVSQYAEEQLQIVFDNTHYLILADHLAYAIKRYQEGMEYAPLNQWELRKLYPEEYAVAIEALKMINQAFSIDLDQANC